MGKWPAAGQVALSVSHSPQKTLGCISNLLYLCIRTLRLENTKTACVLGERDSTAGGTEWYISAEMVFTELLYSCTDRFTMIRSPNPVLYDNPFSQVQRSSPFHRKKLKPVWIPFTRPYGQSRGRTTDGPQAPAARAGAPGQRRAAAFPAPNTSWASAPCSGRGVQHCLIKVLVLFGESEFQKCYRSSPQDCLGTVQDVPVKSCLCPSEPPLWGTGPLVNDQLPLHLRRSLPSSTVFPPSPPGPRESCRALPAASPPCAAPPGVPGIAGLAPLPPPGRLLE